MSLLVEPIGFSLDLEKLIRSEFEVGMCDFMVGLPCLCFVKILVLF